MLGGQVTALAKSTRRSNRPARAGKDCTRRRSSVVNTFFTQYVEARPIGRTKELVDKLMEENFGAPIEIELEEGQAKFAYGPHGLNCMELLQSIHFILDHDKVLKLDLFRFQKAS